MSLLFRLGNITYLLDITPINHCHIRYHLHPFHFVLFKDLVAKQYPSKCRGRFGHTHTIQGFGGLAYMYTRDPKGVHIGRNAAVHSGQSCVTSSLGFLCGSLTVHAPDAFRA